MQIHCLGTTGYHPSASRHTACYYLPQIDLLLDAGTGLFRLVEILRKTPREELEILLSHAHLDHVMGLTFLLNVMAATPLKRVRLHGHPRKLQAVRENLFHPDLFPVAPEFEFCPLDGEQGRLVLDRCSIEYYPLEHPGGSLGFLIHGRDKTVAYLTDTTPRIQSEWIERLRGIDLLMHECYFDDCQQELAIQTGHSWLSAVTRLVELTTPKQTLLIHVNPLVESFALSDELRACQARLNMHWACDNMCVEVS